MKYKPKILTKYKSVEADMDWKGGGQGLEMRGLGMFFSSFFSRSSLAVLLSSRPLPSCSLAFGGMWLST